MRGQYDLAHGATSSISLEGIAGTVGHGGAGCHGRGVTNGSGFVGLAGVKGVAGTLVAGVLGSPAVLSPNNVS